MKLATKFLSQTHRHADRHFPKIVKSCSGHPETCKSIKNRKSKICTKPILSSTESKKKLYKKQKEEEEKKKRVGSTFVELLL